MPFYKTSIGFRALLQPDLFTTSTVTLKSLHLSLSAHALILHLTSRMLGLMAASLQANCLLVLEGMASGSLIDAIFLSATMSWSMLTL